MVKKSILLVLIIVFCMLVAPTFRGFPAVAEAPHLDANEGQFIFFQVNGGTTATVNPGGQVTFTFSFLPHLFMNLGTVQIVDVPDNSLANFIGSIPDPFVWIDKAAETPCNGSITYSVANIAGSNFTVYAIFTMETDSGNYSFVSSVVQVNVVGALDIQKTTTATSVLKGNTFSYTIIVTNNSGAAVNNVTVQDLLNNSLDYVAASVTPTVSGQALTWNLGTMQNNDMRVITLTVQPKSTAVAGTVVNNTAQVSATGMGSSQSISGDTIILEPLAIDLFQGWNLIGIPSRQAAPWSSLSISRNGQAHVGLDQAADAGWISRTAYSWAGTFYQPIGSGGTFEPMKGYWFKALVEGLTLYFPQ